MYNHLRKLDWLLIVVVLLLSGAGLLTIYGIGSAEAMVFLKKQIIFLGLGLLVMLGLSFFDYRIFKNHTSVLIAFYLFSLLSLFFVLSAPQIRGAASWFRLGPLGIEPIEFIKIVIILLLAKYFSFRHIEMYRIRHLVVSGIYIGLPISIIVFQPDFGAILVLFSIWFGLIIISGVKRRHLIAVSLILIILFASGWFFILKDYQKERILSFLDPQKDPYGRGYHISQSLIAIGSGGIFGQGLGFNSQAGLRFLPEQHNDFIFATLAEQRGLIGVSFLFFLFAVLFWRIVKTALNASNNFSRLFAAGFLIMVFTQMLINVGMNMGVLPITGLNLPLVSYGGSSLLSIFIGLGILQSIRARS
jgi:rod shape determining protein RodA